MRTIHRGGSDDPDREAEKRLEQEPNYSRKPLPLNQRGTAREQFETTKPGTVRS